MYIHDQLNIKAIKVLQSNLLSIAQGVSDHVVTRNKGNIFWRLINIFDNHNFFEAKENITGEIIYFYSWLVGEWSKNKVDKKITEYLMSDFYFDIEHECKNLYPANVDYEKYQLRRKEYDGFVESTDKTGVSDKSLPQNMLAGIISKELKKYDNSTKKNILGIINYGMHELFGIMRTFILMNKE